MDARSTLFGFQYILERGWTEVLLMKRCIEIQGGARHVQHISLHSEHRGERNVFGKWKGDPDSANVERRLTWAII